MTKADTPNNKMANKESPKRSLKEMLHRLQALPKPDKIEERDTEELPGRSGL